MPSHTAARRTGVVAAGFITFLNLYAPQALLPTLSDAFRSDPAHVGVTVTATLLAVAIVAPFVGGISDAVGRRWLIVVAAMLLVMPGLAMCWAGSLHALVLARFVQGLMLPFVFAVTVAYIGDECRGAEAARVTSLYAIASIVAGFAGRFIAGWVTEYAGWRAAFLVLAVLTLICAVVIMASLPMEEQFRPTQGWRGSIEGFVDQFRNAQVMSTCAAGFAMLFSVVGTFTFITLYLAGPAFRLGPGALGNIFVIYLVGAAGTPVASRISQRWGRQRTHALACAVASFGIMVTLLPSLFPGLGLGAIMIGLGIAVAGLFAEQVLSLGHIAATARQARSTAVGLYVTCFYAGGAAGSVAPGELWRAFGWPGPAVVIVLMQAAAAVITWMVWRRFTPMSPETAQETLA